MTMADRIVVMDKGVMQQCDAPGTVYKYPENCFVARFIGTPQMNMLDCRLEEDEDIVRCIIGDNVFELTDELGKKLKETEAVSKSVVLGIRPEHIFLNKGSGIKMTMHHLENTGADNYLYFISDQISENVIVRISDGLDSFAVGKNAELSFDFEKIRFFDKKSGLALI